jgi:hypothetical protein
MKRALVYENINSVKRQSNSDSSKCKHKSEDCVTGPHTVLSCIFRHGVSEILELGTEITRRKFQHMLPL